MPDQTVHCVVERAAKLSDPTRKTLLHEPLAYDNAYAHSMRYRAYNDDGTEADLTGYSVVGAFTPSGHNTIKPLLNGTVSGNVAELILPSACYKHPGRFKFTMNLTKGSVSRSVLWVEGMVERNQTDTIEAPTEVLDVSQVITDAQTATANANAAVDRANGIANSLVNDSVNAITAAGTQQRQSVNDLGDQLKDYLEDHYGETTDKVAAKANRSSVSTIKHAIGADGRLTLTDALNEPAKKMTIHLEPKQDLHGYDHPWIGGTGKNLCAGSVKSETAFGLTVQLNEDGTFLVSGTYQRDTTTEYYSGNSFTLPAGTYILSGTPYNNLGYQLRVKNGSTTLCSGNNTFTLSESTTVLVALYVPYSSSGKALPASGFLFEPMIRLSTITDTTYEPYSNICPIEGFDSINVTSVGKNLFPSNWETGTIDTSGNPLDTDTSYYRVQKIKVEPNCNYFLSFNGTAPGASSSAFRYFLYKADGSFANVFAAITGPQSITTGTDTGYISFRWHKELALTDIQLEKGSVATSYEPFGQSLSLNLVSSAGSTVYGGTVTVNEDGSGTLVVDKAKISFAGKTWSANGTFANTYGIVVTNDNPRHAVDDNLLKESLSNKYVWYNSATVGSMDYGFGMSINNDLQFYVKDKDIATVEEANSKLSDLEISYPLHYPVSYTLTAAQLKTLVGINHIWTDGTNIELDYRAEKYADLDKLFSALPKDTATGNPASFTDGADGLPLDKLTVAIEPKQDLHGYDHPWIGGAGKNLTSNTGSTISNSNYVIGSGSPAYINLDHTEYSAGTYKFSFDISNATYPSHVQATLYNGSTSVGTTTIVVDSNGRKSMSITANGAFNKWQVYSNSQSGGVFTNIQLEQGSTANPYEPYSNVCPIEAWDEVNVTRCGKNLFDESNLEMITVLQDGTTKRYGKSFSNLTPGSYTVSAVVRSVYSRHLYAKIVSSDGSFGSAIQVADSSSGSATIQISSGETLLIYIDAQDATDGDGVFDLVYDVQLEAGSTATAYEPYQGQTLSVSLKSVAGSSVYGGTLTVNRDGTGELTVDHHKVVLTGIENWKTNTVAAGLYYLENMPYRLIKNNGRIISDKFVTTNVAGTAMSVGQMKISGTNVNFKTQYATVNDWKNALASNNVTVCYEMASPVTYSLTAQQITTLLGTNHISCDAGEVTVTYHADPTLFITKKIAQALNA